MSANRPWNLESFIDSLVVELDRARETLAVKAINQPMTYTVKDIAMDLQLFPTFNGKQVQFVTAKPGESGASKLSVQLGSISDQQIRQTSKQPISKDDVSIDVIDEIDEDTKDSLRKIGVSSIKDIEKIENKNVDLEKVSKRKVSYGKLAGLLKKARRGNKPPVIKSATLTHKEGEPILSVKGENLAIEKDFEPIAVLNNQLMSIQASAPDELLISVDQQAIRPGENELVMTLDPFAVFKIKLNS